MDPGAGIQERTGIKKRKIIRNSGHDLPPLPVNVNLPHSSLYVTVGDAPWSTQNMASTSSRIYML